MLLHRDSLPDDLRSMNYKLIPVTELEQPTKAYYLVQDPSGEQVCEAVVDTISEEQLVIVTMFNGTVERDYLNGREIEDYLEAVLSRLLQEAVTVR